MKEKGLVHLYTGEGKGKTTAAMGLVVRALGYKKKIYIIQFFKGRETGEKNFLEKESLVTFERTNRSSGFYFNLDQKEKEIYQKNIIKGWDKVEKIVTGGDYDLIVLDEIIPVLAKKIIEVEKMVKLIKNKSPEVELILTGRNAPESIIEKADYVTEMKKIKHPFSRDITARKGIEY